MTITRRLNAVDLTLGYTDTQVVGGLDVAIPPGQVTVIVGANACGKSTLLRGLARLLTPRGGAVLLDGTNVTEMAGIDVAKVIGLLPQSPVAPDGITVADLVGRGRYPHQGWFRRWSAACTTPRSGRRWRSPPPANCAERTLSSLSGGQRQRVLGGTDSRAADRDPVAR